MTVEEARHVLGVPEGTSLENLQIIRRQRIRTAHPDSGTGSDELASVINQAYDVLKNQIQPNQPQSDFEAFRRRQRLSLANIFSDEFLPVLMEYERDLEAAWAQRRFFATYQQRFGLFLRMGLAEDADRIAINVLGSHFEEDPAQADEDLNRMLSMRLPAISFLDALLTDDKISYRLIDTFPKTSVAIAEALNVYTHEQNSNYSRFLSLFVDRNFRFDQFEIGIDHEYFQKWIRLNPRIESLLLSHFLTNWANLRAPLSESGLHALITLLNRVDDNFSRVWAFTILMRYSPELISANPSLREALWAIDFESEMSIHTENALRTPLGDDLIDQVRVEKLPPEHPGLSLKEEYMAFLRSGFQKAACQQKLCLPNPLGATAGCSKT